MTLGLIGMIQPGKVLAVQHRSIESRHMMVEEAKPGKSS